MAFKGDVVVRQLDPTDWELREPLTYRGNRDSFTVPAGFRTDFASVPRAVVWLLPRYGDYTKAAILHDYLWRSDVVSRADADGLFRRAMRELGVPVPRRWLMWGAVRLASGMSGASARDWAAFVLVVVAALALVAVPAFVVQVYLVLFWVVELLFWLGRRGSGHDDPRPPLPLRTT